MRTLFWTATLLIGGLWFWLTGDSAGDGVAVSAVVMTALGLTWQQTRLRARRWLAVLDAHADRELAHAVTQSGRVQSAYGRSF